MEIVSYLLLTRNIMKSLLCTFLVLLFAVISHSQEIRSFQKDGRYGFLQNGNTTISPEYEYAFDFKEGLALVKKGNYWGFIDSNNSTIVPFEYDRCSEFKGGFSIVQKNGKLGIIDEGGNVVVPVECDHVEVLKDSYCIGQKNGKYALFISGEQQSEFAFERIETMSYGYFGVKNNDRYGVMAPDGNVLIEAQFISKPYCYKGRDQNDAIYFTGYRKKRGSRSYYSQSGALVLNGDEYDLKQVKYPCIYAATKDGKTKVVDVSNGMVILPPTEVSFTDPTWRPCDGYGYSSTPQLFFEKPDGSYFMVSLNKPENTAEIFSIPIVFEEFLLIQKKNGLYDIYSHDVQLLDSDFHASIDNMGTFNPEVRICSFEERGLMIWKNGSFAIYDPDEQAIELVNSGKIGENLIFGNIHKTLPSGTTVNFIDKDENHFLFEIISENTKWVYLMKDNVLLWEMETFSADDKIKLKEFQYDEMEEGENYKPLVNVVLKVNGKKEHFGW
ncbi:MAG: hypothetical protein Crog4KO_29430 [Crocinitomicaceae bacterium]